MAVGRPSGMRTGLPLPGSRPKLQLLGLGMAGGLIAISALTPPTAAKSEVHAAKARSLPAVSLTTTATRLSVDVDPDLPGSSSWRFDLFRQSAGKWRKVGTYSTKGRAEIRSLRVKPGTYRVRIRQRPGFRQLTSPKYVYPTSATAAPVTPAQPAPSPAREQPPSTAPATPSPTQTPWWSPLPGTDWQWQLHGILDTTVSAPVFDIDGQTTSAETVAALKARGIRVICYFSAGSAEPDRPDAAAFPPAAIGKQLLDWPRERWLDVRNPALLPIMEARVADCAAKGFDAVEPDNVDAQVNDSGFPLSVADQLSYDRAIAELAHKYGLGVALKNYPSQVDALVSYFDFAVVEECVRVRECGSYASFTRAAKAVLAVEYQGTLNDICPVAQGYGFSAMLKTPDLTAWRAVCP